MLWPLLVYAGAVLVLVVGMMLLSYVLGERHREPATGEPYESGVVSTGSARVRLSVQFYLVAMFFVIFDLESVFLVAWAIAARQSGWAGYIEMVIFAVVLLAGLVYLWREGALDWGPQPGTRRADLARGPGLPTAETPVRREPDRPGIQESLPSSQPLAPVADGGAGPQRIPTAVAAARSEE